MINDYHIDLWMCSLCSVCDRRMALVPAVMPRSPPRNFKRPANRRKKKEEEYHIIKHSHVA